jgi:hypothetical protein
LRQPRDVAISRRAAAHSRSFALGASRGLANARTGRRVRQNPANARRSIVALPSRIPVHTRGEPIADAEEVLSPNRKPTKMQRRFDSQARIHPAHTGSQHTRESNGSWV